MKPPLTVELGVHSIAWTTYAWQFLELLGHHRHPAVLIGPLAVNPQMVNLLFAVLMAVAENHFILIYRLAEAEFDFLSGQVKQNGDQFYAIRFPLITSRRLTNAKVNEHARARPTNNFCKPGWRLMRIFWK